ncbi:MAG: outer membrane protein assembly factor BamE [Fuerstiella sp.]|nr:outer membrane protein assembly factor BamE [Fuerstiella sp.]
MSISRGMSKAEVIEIAGELHYEDPHGWYYSVWNGCVTYSDMLYVSFDKNNRVDWVSF